ncbi:hypothetical protein DRP04_05855 [Archaeoglobales archaeon]|nr:MAG: hypothetical protein DRP04_05855 [Archaeoglobales archaeon]
MRKEHAAGIAALILFFGLFQPIISAKVLGASITPKLTYIDVLLSIADQSVFKDPTLKSNPLIMITFLTSALGYVSATVLASLYASGVSRAGGVYSASQALAWISFGSGVALPYLLFREMTKGLPAFAKSFASSFGDLSPGIAVYLAGLAAFLMFYLPSRR